MTYVESLRVRRALIVLTILLAITVALSLLGIFFAHGSVQVGEGHHGTTSDISLRAGLAADFTKHGTHVPVSALFFMAGFVATIIATVLGAYLAGERRHTPLAWTKPVSRERFALANFGVDAIGILIAFVIMLVLGEFVVIWALGIVGFMQFDARAWTTLALSLGIPFAYYGLVRALTVPFPGRAGAIAGASWAVAYVSILFSQLPLPATFHTAFMALNFLNPLAYGTSFSASGGDVGGAVPLGITARIACVWVLAILSGALAVIFYRRAEA